MHIHSTVLEYWSRGYCTLTFEKWSPISDTVWILQVLGAGVANEDGTHDAVEGMDLSAIIGL